MKGTRLSISRAIASSIIAIVPFALWMVQSEARISGRTQSNETRSKSLLAVEQAGNKNIKVLKGMPNAQLIPSMRFMSASLGVRCDYCHVTKNGQLDAAAEDKREKQTAREMIRMVREINRANFKGEAQVSCFTCHTGQPLPQRFPSLPVAKAAASSKEAPDQASPGRSPLPMGIAIIDNYITAVGGQAAIDRITSCIIKGKIATASGLTGTYESEQVPPNYGYESIITSAGSRQRIVNSTSGWEKTSFGVSDLSPDQVPDTKLSLPVLLDAQLKRQYSETEVSGREEIDGHDVYLVDATRKDDKRERLYFDVETGLLLRRISYTPTMIGIIPEQIDFGDYRGVEGLKLPFSVRISTADSNNPTSTRTFEDVKLNVPVDGSKFTKPAGP
jgi:hypothetical protein